MYPSYS
ncbi:hypothetical protein F383_34656 [Gossypium arboreum]|nr:hypothetical protein F383_37237 [Gossypium arboreum]KHG04975.1 hypothetical protein F383_30700 [Gossypium arboreum]KHG23467.1 hypothetical protein F383_29689 [Gossypium arboreum]KHG27665.1 hypothetical protein F383_34656 [Gossypium arboreum]